MQPAPIIIPSGLISVLHLAERIAVLTGVGFSAESGALTFREAQSGLWARDQPQRDASDSTRSFQLTAAIGTNSAATGQQSLVCEIMKAPHPH
jgi:NAD-dependent SIR2 family protein deacetylase